MVCGNLSASFARGDAFGAAITSITAIEVGESRPTGHYVRSLALIDAGKLGGIVKNLTIDEASPSLHRVSRYSGNLDNDGRWVYRERGDIDFDNFSIFRPLEQKFEQSQRLRQLSEVLLSEREIIILENQSLYPV